jgi:hypothetical protein
MMKKIPTVTVEGDIVEYADFQQNVDIYLN